MRVLRYVILRIIFLFYFLFSSSAQAQISGVTVTDVTTRAFSVVWVSDYPVLSANIGLFADADGTQPITAATINVVSEIVAGAHQNGLVKIDVSGLSSNTTFYFSVHSTISQGTDIFPTGNSLVPVTTSVETLKLDLVNQPIVNDLINYRVHGLDGVTPLPGSLVIISMPTVSNYPLSSFVGNFSALDGSSVVDLNNLFDLSGVSAAVVGGEVMIIKELRGLNCLNLENHSMSRFAKVPLLNEVPPVTTLESPTGCFISDRNCDQSVNILDFQFVLNAFNSENGECNFNPDADIVTDQVINILDVQGILNDFGQSVP